MTPKEMPPFAPVEQVPAGPLPAPGSAWPILLADHAANGVPEGLDLGLPAEDMARHIAWDVGARGVTLELAARLQAPAVLSTYSRLVIDPNRGEDDPTLVMRLYDGSVIPGNRRVDQAEIARRVETLYRPYHAAITAEIDAALAAGLHPYLLSIHSFTQQLRGRAPRPWHIGLLWDRDRRLVDPLLAALAEDSDLCIGENEPYTGQLAGDCMWRHGTARGLPHVLIEIRNDLISAPEGQVAWAARLAPKIARAVAEAEGAPLSPAQTQ
ncbi:MAG: N-formylglutamate amidohydrolase [Pseudomonadota bacterium]